MVARHSVMLPDTIIPAVRSIYPPWVLDDYCYGGEYCVSFLLYTYNIAMYVIKISFCDAIMMAYLLELRNLIE